MTRAAKVTYLAALFIGLSVGLLREYRSSMSLLKSYHEIRFTIPPYALEEFTREQYKHADLEHARAALLTYANVLEEMEKAKADKTWKMELSLTYARLASLGDGAADLEQSRAFMAKARYWNLANGGRDMPDSEMKAALLKIDEVKGWSAHQIFSH